MSHDSITLEVAAREVSGKAVKHLRKDGIVPAIIHVYQHAGKNQPIELKTPGHNYVVLIKDATFEPKKNQLTHLVFNAVDKNQKVDAEVPVHAKYDEENESSPAERNGLIVLAQIETIQVKAIPSEIPEALYYDAEKLVEVGDHIVVADIKLPADVELLTDPNHAVATVFEPSALAAANDDAGGDATAEEATGDADAGESAEGLDAEKQAEAAEAGENKEEKSGE
jgi:large subunit ribosomal protein L25